MCPPSGGSVVPCQRVWEVRWKIPNVDGDGNVWYGDPVIFYRSFVSDSDRGKQRNLADNQMSRRENSGQASSRTRTDEMSRYKARSIRRWTQAALAPEWDVQGLDSTETSIPFLHWRVLPSELAVSNRQLTVSSFPNKRKQKWNIRLTCHSTYSSYLNDKKMLYAFAGLV